MSEQAREEAEELGWKVSLGILLAAQALLIPATEEVHAGGVHLALFSWTSSTRSTMAWTPVSAEVCEDWRPTG